MLAARLTAQLLAGPPAPGPVAVAERLLAVQAQDSRAARLAVRARTSGGSASEVDRALTEERTLVISWLNRATLQLVRAEDYPWLHALTTPQLARGNARRLEQEGVSEAAAGRGVAAIERALSEDGPLPRRDLGARVAAAGVPTAGQALVHLLMLATLRGLIVRGPVIDGRHAFVLVRDWLERPAKFDRDRALSELTRRFLAGHGPATERDLAKWAQLPLRDVRAGLRAVGSEVSLRSDGLVDLAHREPAAALPPPRLLGAWDPVLLGWMPREPLLGEHGAKVVTGGLFRPYAMVRGRAVATWGLRDGRVQLGEPFAPVARRDLAALRADAADVERYLRS